LAARSASKPGELGSYELDSRTVEYHRAQIRSFLGFRECTVGDAEKLTAFLVEGVCQQERRAERVREALLRCCRADGIEQPSAGRVARIVSSALRQAENALITKVLSRIEPDVAERMTALIARAGDDEEAGVEGEGRAMFAR